METREQIDREHLEARRVIYSTAKGHIIQETEGEGLTRTLLERNY